MNRPLNLIVTIALFSLFAFGTAVAAESDSLIGSVVLKTYDLDQSEYSVEIKSNPLKTTGLTSDELTLEPITQKDPIGLFIFLATVTRDNQPVETGQVRVDIRRFAEVMVLTDRFQRFESFAPERMELQRMDVTDLREMPITNFAQLEGLRSGRNLRKGTVLTLAATESIPDIERGDEMTIVYDDGLCRITATGIALQSGQAGDQIRVKNKTTKKIILARIIDDSAVAVDP